MMDSRGPRQRTIDIREPVEVGGRAPTRKAGAAVSHLGKAICVLASIAAFNFAILQVRLKVASTPHQEIDDEDTTDFGSRPHIIFLLADNVGWNNVGYHRSKDNTELNTPHINSLVLSGLELDRAYAWKFCSPSRSCMPNLIMHAPCAIFDRLYAVRVLASPFSRISLFL
jgi:hypothetical protein